MAWIGSLALKLHNLYYILYHGTFHSLDYFLYHGTVYISDDSSPLNISALELLLFPSDQTSRLAVVLDFFFLMALKALPSRT